MKDKEKCKCGCGEDLEEQTECSGKCDCDEDCNAQEDKCNPDCTCEEEKEYKCENDGNEQEDSLENKDYLKDLLRVQAEFDNYRKRMTSALGDARQDGFMDAIIQFLPALDSFKMATEYITDKNTLMGIKFIEKGILDTLEKMGVKAIDATGKFDPAFHQAIDTDTAADVESGYIVKEAYKGFTYKDKVIRYSQVIVKR